MTGVPNPITDAGHELGLAAWLFYGGQAGGVRINDAAAAYAGAYYIRMRVAVGGPSDVFTRAAQYIAIPDVMPRSLRFWVDAANPGTAELRLWVDLYDTYIADPESPPGPPFASWGVAGNDLSAGWQQVDLGLLAPPSMEITLVAWTTRTAGAFVSNADWHIDEWSYLTEAEDNALTKRREIRDAAATAAATITTANGHAVEVANVTTDFRRPDKIESFPEVQVLFMEEEREPGEMHRKRSELSLRLIVWANGTDGSGLDAKAQCDEIAGSVEKVIEAQSGGQHLGLGYVDNAVVNTIDAFESEPDAKLGLCVYAVGVLVTYRYDRLNP